MFKIGYRTIKTAIGAPLSIFIAHMIGLDFYVSAGILTILCIKPTQRKSLISASYRLFASIIAILISSIIFSLLGFNPIAFGIILLIFIPVTVKLKITEGIITSSVIMLHLYSSGAITVGLIINEIVLLIIGLGVALILNLYMPSLENELERIQKELEKNYSQILKEIGHYVKTGDHSWTGKEITEAEKLLEKANSLASKDVENHLLRSHHPYYNYFRMREKQLDTLEQMLPLISRLDLKNTREHKYIGQIFEELSERVHPGNTAIKYLEKLKEIRKRFNKEPLPKSWEQFEERALLYMLLIEIEQYLSIKHEYKAYN